MRRELKSHRAELEALKAADPDFYEYLQQSDKSLLDFEDEGDNGELESEGDDSEEEDEEEEEPEVPEPAEVGKPSREEADQPSGAALLESRILLSASTCPFDCYSSVALTGRGYDANNIRKTSQRASPGDEYIIGAV